MRIRSTKPEFWTSRRIAEVSWDARLVLKGLESYVDDNGVGKDDIALIVTALFSRDLVREPSRILARVSEAISELHEAGLVWRYDDDGTDLLFLAFWDSIQRVDKPLAGRFRRPDGTLAYKESTIRECVAKPREESRSLAPVTGEQGNRGTGEQGHPDADASGGESPRALAVVEGELVDDSPSAQTLIADWIDRCATRPPGRVIGQTAKEVKALLDEGTEPERVREALAEWNRKGLHPSALASVVHELANSGPRVSNRNTEQQALLDRAMRRAEARERNGA